MVQVASLEASATEGAHVIAGRYRLEKEIGRGGAGVVHLAHDELLDRRVAVKRIGLLPGTTDDDVVRAAARGAARCRDQPPQRGVDLRPRQGRGLLLAGDGARGGPHARRAGRGRRAAPGPTCGRRSSPRPPTPSSRPAPPGSSTATSSPATSSSAPTTTRSSATSASPGPPSDTALTQTGLITGLPRLPRARGGVRRARDRRERRVVARRHAVPRGRRHGRRTTSGTTSWAASTGSSTTTRPACPTTTRSPGCWPRCSSRTRRSAGRWRRSATTCGASHVASSRRHRRRPVATPRPRP